jgi:hypothetical protein
VLQVLWLELECVELSGADSTDFALLAWLIFSLVRVWAPWNGLSEFVQSLQQQSEGREELRCFPDEPAGEPGPGMFGVYRGGIDRGGDSSRDQANDEGDGGVVVAAGAGSVRDSGNAPRRRVGTATRARASW